MGSPVKIIILSGKRKSGKDYFAHLLAAKLGADQCDTVTLSAPLKQTYAEIHGLDYKRLLDSSQYKEKYRESMIAWGESERNKDPELFCRLASKDCSKPVWIVTDARRPSDIEYFKKYFNEKTILVRINASEIARTKRGWKFVHGVDDAPSECALDSRIDWDVTVDNSGQGNAPEIIQEKLLQICSETVLSSSH